MSMFDAEEFLNTSIDQELDTRIIPVPEGEYQGVVEAVKLRDGESERGPWAALDVTFKLEVDSQVAETIGRPEPRSRFSVFLDLTDDGQLDTSKGKNVRLGQLREAFGQNRPGPWAPRDLEGCGPVKCMVTHRFSKDGEETYDQVSRVFSEA